MCFGQLYVKPALASLPFFATRACCELKGREVCFFVGVPMRSVLPARHGHLPVNLTTHSPPVVVVVTTYYYTHRHTTPTTTPHLYPNQPFFFSPPYNLATSLLTCLRPPPSLPSYLPTHLPSYLSIFLLTYRPTFPPTHLPASPPASRLPPTLIPTLLPNPGPCPPPPPGGPHFSVTRPGVGQVRE